MRTKKTQIQQDSSLPVIPKDIQAQDITFALDIGTRSVVGILGINKDSCFHVIDYEQKFHSERAMRDGQIEDIDLVASVVKDVKETLEKRHHITLNSVSIAAAGRALKTRRVTYEQACDPTEEVTQKLLQAMEYCAVGLAQEEFYSNENEDDTNSFYCVGYSVINYRLDNYPISTLIGHKGKKISVELIAAFLPQNVVQSLYTVMRMNNLSVDNLTLEPIAAINVIVPKDIRLLNIALVDIGAGTSDIAISKNGSIVAYDMVTTAGDEITETIMQNYLTDFETAENIKISLSNDENDITFQDIMGNSRTENKSKLLKTIRPAIQSLSSAISKRILEINDVAPLAVFLVGGGSQISELCKLVAQELNLSPNYVSIGGKQPFKNITLFSDKLQNPEFVTPIGIGTLTSLYKGCDFFSITVNGKKLMLLNYGNAKVIDALLLSSIKPQNLIGISARSIIFYINGEKCVKRGSGSIPGEIYVNGSPASIDTKINQGDEVVVKSAIDGKPPEIKISDLKQSSDLFAVTIDDMEIKIEPTYMIDEKILQDDYVIHPLDSITIIFPTTIKELFDSLDIDAQHFSTITVNGERADLETPIENGYHIATSEFSPQVLELEEENQEEQMNETQKEEETQLSEDTFRVCINEKWQTVIPNEKNQVFFFDMLNYVDIDTKNPQGNIILKLNGSDAAYTSPIKNGDSVEIRWDKEL